MDSAPSNQTNDRWCPDAFPRRAEHDMQSTNDLASALERQAPCASVSVAHETLDAAAELIRTSLRRRPRLPELAAAAGLSQFYFHRRFKHHFGETPLQMTARLQIDAAKRLLRCGVPIREVAARCGFSHQSHMNTRVKQATGAAPGQWLRTTR